MQQPSIQNDPDSLAESLRQAEIIKQDMTELLRQLETKATGKSIAKPGTWRHHPSDWAKQYPSKNKPE
jgi:hypothetical protein